MLLIQSRIGRDMSKTALGLIIILEVLSAIGGGIYMIWMRIDYSEISWQIDESKRKLSEKIALHDKLEIERDRLLAPGILRQNAFSLGMHQAPRKQIRRLSHLEAYNK